MLLFPTESTAFSSPQCFYLDAPSYPSSHCNTKISMYGYPSYYDPGYEAELAEYEHARRLRQAQEEVARQEAILRAQRQKQPPTWPYYTYEDDDPWTAPVSNSTDFASYSIDGRPRYTYGEPSPTFPEPQYRRPPFPPSTVPTPPRSPLRSQPHSREPHLTAQRPLSRPSSIHSTSPPPSARSFRTSSPVPCPQPSKIPTHTGPSPAEKVAARRLQKFWRTRSLIRKKLAELKTVEGEFIEHKQNYNPPSS